MSCRVWWHSAALAVCFTTLLGFWGCTWMSPPPTAPLPARSPQRLLPVAYWHHRVMHPERYTQVACARPPHRAQLSLAAAAWQLLPLPTGHLYLYGAYWDDRFQEPVVRVLVYCDVHPPPPLVCLLWYEDENAPDRVPALLQYAWRREWGGPADGVNEPYVAVCGARRHPPAPPRAPAALSLVLHPQLCGTPTNILNVQGAPRYHATARPDNRAPAAMATQRKDSVCVCLKWIQFQDDISASLVEWIEFIKEFGATYLFAFMVQGHPNTERVVRHYARAGFVEVTPYAHAPQLRGSGRFPARVRDFLDYRRELLPLNDCLHRARARGCHWVLPLDSDEIIVPQHNYSTWQEVIAAETRHVSGVDALACRNYYFLDGAQKNLSAPTYSKIFGHRWRSRRPSPLEYNVKSFHNTSSVVAMHNHFPISCQRECRSINVNESVARLQHYRGRCGDGGASCPALRDTLYDDTIARWRHVVLRVQRVLSDMRLVR